MTSISQNLLYPNYKRGFKIFKSLSTNINNSTKNKHLKFLQTLILSSKNLSKQLTSTKKYFLKILKSKLHLLIMISLKLSVILKHTVMKKVIKNLSLQSFLQTIKIQTISKILFKKIQKDFKWGQVLWLWSPK